MSIFVKKKTMKEKQIELALQKVVQNLDLTDSEAMEISEMYPKWEPGKVYQIGTVLRFGLNSDNEPQLFKVLQQHTSQSNFKPFEALSLFKKVGFTDEGVSIWTQPFGREDAYQKGDTVSRNGKTYISTVDNNVWIPGIYGWEEKE